MKNNYVYLGIIVFIIVFISYRVSFNIKKESYISSIINVDPEKIKSISIMIKPISTKDDSSQLVQKKIKIENKVSLKKICDEINRAEPYNITRGNCKNRIQKWGCMLEIIDQTSKPYYCIIKKTCINGTILTIRSKKTWGFFYGAYRNDTLSKVLESFIKR